MISVDAVDDDVDAMSHRFDGLGKALPMIAVDAVDVDVDAMHDLIDG